MNSFNKNSHIKILGSDGGKNENMELTSIQITDDTIIDAGNIINGMGKDILKINHIFITHTHLDHILDIGLLIDTTFQQRETPLHIYGSKGTILNLKKYIFNWDIWPDFSTIDLLNSTQKALKFIELSIGDEIELDYCKVKAIENNHTNTSNGYIVTKAKSSILLTSDTYLCNSIWDEINTNKQISSVVVDVSFPSSMDILAAQSKHLTPKLLQNELTKLQRDDVSVYISHIKPGSYTQVSDEIENLNLLKNKGKILKMEDIIQF